MHPAHPRAVLLAMLAVCPLISAKYASAAIVISEVDAVGSSSTSAADWFELTNTGSSAVTIAGWKMDDNSASFGSAVTLSGVTSIAAGQSVVFIEDTGSTDATVNANFKSAWFGANVPASLVLGNYGGSGVGLSSGGDAVNIFDAGGNLVTGVSFGESTLAGGSFDNTAGLSNKTLSQFSVAGVNGAFNSRTSGEIGSPGIQAAPVPLPAAGLMFLGGLGLLGPFGGRRRTR